LRDAPYAGLFQIFYQKYKTFYEETFSLSSDSIPNQLLSGTSSAIFSTLITQPFDVIRTRSQLQNIGESTGVLNLTLQIYRNDGMKFFFRGLFSRLLKRGTHAPVVWTCYEQIVKYLEK
jgi:solute carrier family 25, member 38